MDTLKEIVDLFGSPQALADAVSAERRGRAVSRASVYMWRLRGVPESSHAALIEACRKRGRDLTIAEIASLAPRETAA